MKNAKPNKVKLHTRNKHQGRYDLTKLCTVLPELKEHITKSIRGEDTIDFANPISVRTLNKSILNFHYNIKSWDIPEGYLCPPIPGRVDYIHHASDVLGSANFGNIPRGSQITCMDIGVGSSCIYPILGHSEYGWSFIGTDIDEISLQSSQQIIDNNNLSEYITLRHKSNAKDVFFGVLGGDDKIDITVCNPPFHSSAAEAEKASRRKVRNLTKKDDEEITRNFGGQSNELWCDGGERKFIHQMIKQSKKYTENLFWCSTLVSKQSNIDSIKDLLFDLRAEDVVITPMGQGNKSSRMVAWTFHDKESSKAWKANWK